jgi:hypothetical protein
VANGARPEGSGPLCVTPPTIARVSQFLSWSRISVLLVNPAGVIGVKS